MKFQIKKLVNLVLIISMVSTTSALCVRSSSSALTSKQWNVADRIAEVVSENYETYGVLPSVAVAQAFNETTLGTYGSGPSRYNYWGIGPGESYSSFYSGCIRYMRVINNGHYKNAPFNKSYRGALRAIVDGGYCQPPGSYYTNAVNAIQNYGFTKYDIKLFRKLAAKKKAEERRQKILAEKARQKAIALKKAKEAAERKQRQSQVFTVIYEQSIPSNCIGVNKKIVPSGSISLWADFEMVPGTRIYDVYEFGTDPKQNYIYSSDRLLQGKKVCLQVQEKAVG